MTDTDTNTDTNTDGESIDPADATVTEDFISYLGQVVRVEAPGSAYTFKLYGARPLAIVDFHPEWAIEALERDPHYEPRRVGKEEFEQAQRNALGVEDEDEDEGGEQ